MCLGFGVRDYLWFAHFTFLPLSPRFALSRIRHVSTKTAINLSCYYFTTLHFASLASETLYDPSLLHQGHNQSLVLLLYDIISSVSRHLSSRSETSAPSPQYQPPACSRQELSTELKSALGSFSLAIIICPPSAMFADTPGAWKKQTSFCFQTKSVDVED